MTFKPTLPPILTPNEKPNNKPILQSKFALDMLSGALNLKSPDRAVRIGELLEMGLFKLDSSGLLVFNPNGLETPTGIVVGRNVLINGDFRYGQRGVSFGFAATARYSLDRWFLWGAGSQIGGNQRINDDTSIPVTVQNRGRKAFQVSVTSVAGANNYALIQQRVEDVRTLAGGPVTFSGWIFSDADKVISVNFYQIFGTGGSTTVQIPAKTVSLKTGWQYVVLRFDLPHIVNKVISATDSALWLNIWLDAGVNNDTPPAAGGIGQKSGTYWFSQIQLERGRDATPFDLRPDATELLLCQRYYQKSFSTNTAPSVGVGGNNMIAAAYGSTVARASVNYFCPMRALPSVGIYRSESATGNAAAAALFNPSTGLWVAGNVASGVGAFRDTGFHVDIFSDFTLQGVGAYLAAFHWTADSEL